MHVLITHVQNRISGYLHHNYPLMCFTKVVRIMFEDKRSTMILLAVWMIIACIVFNQLGAFHMHFMTFGPSEETIFMGMVINTWNKWYCLAAFSFVNTATNEFLGNALMPWYLDCLAQLHTTNQCLSYFVAY